jgi:hypothetical protein
MMGLLVPFAKDSSEMYIDAGPAALCLGVLLFPLGYWGVYGIIKAFQGCRREALRSGLYAGVPTAFYYALLFACLLIPPSDDRPNPADDLQWLLCAGIVPFAGAFWAILLAYLIPEKPSADDPF